MNPEYVGCPEVRIVRETRGGIDGWSVYDGEAWFGYSETISDALHYASDLLHGPGVGPRGSVWNLMRAIEETGYNPQGGATFEQRMALLDIEVRASSDDQSTGKDAQP